MRRNVCFNEKICYFDAQRFFAISYDYHTLIPSCRRKNLPKCLLSADLHGAAILISRSYSLLKCLLSADQTYIKLRRSPTLQASKQTKNNQLQSERKRVSASKLSKNMTVVLPFSSVHKITRSQLRDPSSVLYHKNNYCQRDTEMAKLNGGPLHPSKQGPSVFEQNSSFFFYRRKPMTIKKKNLFTGPVARLLGPAIFEASKPKVLLLEVENKQPAAGELPPRTCTLTNCLAPSIICKTKALPSTIFSWACQYAIILLAFILLLSFIPFR